MNSAQLLAQFFTNPPQLLGHTVNWHGKPGATNKPVGYDSSNQFALNTLLDLMQQDGYAGVVALTYGSTSGFINDVCEKMLYQCWVRKMSFMLSFDPWAVGDKSKIAAMAPADQVKARTAGFIAALDFCKPFFINPAYVSEKYVIDFATGAAVSADDAKQRGVTILPTYSQCAWPKPQVADPAGDLIQQNAKALIPAMFRRFNDSGLPKLDASGAVVSRDYSQSVWGGPARVVEDDGGGVLWRILRAMPATKYVQYVTIDDRDEGTDELSRLSLEYGKEILNTPVVVS